MADGSEKTGSVVALPVKLSPVEQSDQPVSANYTTVGVAQGIVYVDFGFIEPSVLGAVVREAREGKATSKTLEGKLVVRVALPLEALVRLQQQVGQVLVGLRGKRETKEK